MRGAAHPGPAALAHAHASRPTGVRQTHPSIFVVLTKIARYKHICFDAFRSAGAVRRLTTCICTAEFLISTTKIDGRVYLIPVGRAGDWVRGAAHPGAAPLAHEHAPRPTGVRQTRPFIFVVLDGPVHLLSWY